MYRYQFFSFLYKYTYICNIFGNQSETQSIQNKKEIIYSSKTNFLHSILLGLASLQRKITFRIF